jgi:formylglycine-generating enzyme required for sulfatase activity
MSDMPRRSPLSALAAGVPLLLAALSSGPAVQVVSDARFHETISGTLVEFEMARVPGGAVEVPGPDGPVSTDVAEFYIGRTEVTWDMYDVFALGLDTPGADAGSDAIARPSNPYGSPDYGWGHAGFPVMSVTRDAAEAFCVWLSAKTGRAYRLPTEAEWQRAADLAVGADEGGSHVGPTAWNGANAGRRTHAVATRQPDALGLFDLFGNTAEWVTTPDGARVTRGGSYRDPSVGPDTRAVQDDSWNETDPQLPKSRWWLSDGPFVGFRLAATPEGEHP